jgi:hypothetical protein
MQRKALTEEGMFCLLKKKDFDTIPDLHLKLITHLQHNDGDSHGYNRGYNMGREQGLQEGYRRGLQEECVKGNKKEPSGKRSQTS